jgi:nitrate reductase delta subunit
MKILKVLSALLSYPSAELKAAIPEIDRVLAGAGSLSVATRAGLGQLLEEIDRSDLYELQERYVALFDRGRQLSLHLFEHVHGESRDRGQAMVNLIETYRSHGLELSSRELPDYLPLFLEFLSEVPEQQARQLLNDAMPIIVLLGERLRARSCAYSGVLDAVISLGGAPTDTARIRRRVASEGPDEAIEQMDRIWEEEAVSFMGGPSGGCRAGPPIEQPVRQMTRR